MNKKKIIFVILVFAVILSVVFILATTKKDTVSFITPKEPVLQQKYKGKYTISTSLERSAFSFPEKLPFLIKTPSNTQLNDGVVRKMALNLGFTGEPMTIEDSVDGKTYFWKNNNTTLFVYLKTGKVRYSTGTFSPGINKQLSDASILSTAQDFILKNEILDEPVFQMGKVKKLKQIPDSEGFQETNKNDAVLFQIGISPKNTDYEFITTSSVEPISYIELKTDGSVYSFQTTVFPSIQKGATEYTLKKYDEVVSSLEGATLIELREETQLLSDIPPTLIQNIEVNKIEIAYLIESASQTEYQPIYKLSGEATLSDSQNKYGVVLYLPALSN